MNKGATSDTEGYFEIRKVAPGNYQVMVSFVGFDQMEKAVEVKCGEETRVDFVLNETSAQLSEIVVRGERDGYEVDVPGAKKKDLNRKTGKKKCCSNHFKPP